MHEQKFQKALGGLVNMEIGFLLSDNQFIKGILLDVKQDHIVVKVNQNVFYFAHQHIQVLSKNAKDSHISSEIVHYVNKNYLADVLKALRYNWVSINSLGDRALFGVLSRISDDHVTVINNSEILYIPKSYISNISEKQNIKNEKQEQLKFQDCQIEEQIASDHTQKEIELITAVEVPILDNAAGKITEDENVISVQPEVDPKTRVEIYTALLHVLKRNLLNRYMEIDRREDIIQETANHGFIVHIGDESKEQSDSLIVEMKDCQVEEQVVIEPTQTINETKPIKSLEAPLIEDLAGKGTEFGNVTKESSEASLRSVKYDLLKKINEDSLEEDNPGALESSNQVSWEEQLVSKQSRVKRKRKRLLLSAWSTVNNDPHAIVNHKSPAKENESPDCKEDSVKGEQLSESNNSILQRLHDQYLEEDCVTSEEKPDSAEITAFQFPTTQMNPKKEKEMLEKQYYALMKQAETNCFHMSERQLNLSEEEQYLALMKHAAKMYHEFKN